MSAKVLFIGGTGNVSAACSRLAVAEGLALYLLTRNARPLPGARALVADAKNAGQLHAALANHAFDAVVNFIAFDVEDVKRDLEVLRGRCKQYVFISSASCYAKPWLAPITEDVPLHNPVWEYSQKKIACERFLEQAAAEPGCPAITIIRPSLTYDTVIPVPLGGWTEWTMAERMLAGKPAIVHGDGLSPWTVTHSEDLALGLVGLLVNPRAYGEAFHITGDEVQTWDQIYTKLAQALGVRPNLVHVASETIARVMPDRAGSLLGDKSHSLIFDNSKLKACVPTFKQQIPFAEGITRTIAWFRADPARQRVSSHVHAHLDQLAALA